MAIRFRKMEPGSWHIGKLQKYQFACLGCQRINTGIVSVSAMTFGSQILLLGNTGSVDGKSPRFHSPAHKVQLPASIGNSQQDDLDGDMDYDSIFAVVKKSVKQVVHKERAGLGLALADLPATLGAFWEVGGNYIVMNEALIRAMVSLAKTRTEFNSFIYSILTHEYLHSVGFIDEAEAREMTAIVAREYFGPDHPASVISSVTPWTIYPELLEVRGIGNSGFKIVSRFDSDSTSYIN